MSLRLIHLLLAPILAFAGGISAVQGDSCVAARLQPHLVAARAFDVRKAAEWVKNNREQILKGYRLPPEYTAGYFARRIEPYLANPRYEAVANPTKVYRGMFLSVDDLSRILEQGHEVSKVQWTTGGGGLSFSTSIEEAKTYIFHSADSRADGIGVIFEVEYSKDMKLLEDARLNPTRTIFKTAQDVSPSRISNVMLWGQWGSESLEEVMKKASAGSVTPHQRWTDVFGR